MAYQAPKLEYDFKTPRLRNIALYALTFGLAKWVEAYFSLHSAVSTGFALVAYGIMFDAINPDMFLNTEMGAYQTNYERKNLIIKPLVQPVKDLVNIFRLRKIKF